MLLEKKGEKGMSQKRYYYEVGWRLNREQREKLKEAGFHIYATRSWDEGTGCTLEHRVIVNHESDIVTNWEALDESNPDAIANNFYKFMDECDAINSYDGDDSDCEKFHEQVSSIINQYDK